MKLLISLLLVLFAPLALAADVTASVTVLYEGKQVFRQTNEFVGMTAEEAAALQKGATRQLDLAAKAQDKGGGYTIIWKWADQPAIETQGMKFGDVRKVMREGTKWLTKVVDDADAAEAKGKKKPWGKQ